MRHRASAWLGIAALLIAVGAKANLLVDGGFETNYNVNWSYWDSGNIIQPTGWGWQHGGQRMIGMWWWAGVYQDVAVVPGSNYALTGYAFMPEDDPAKNGVYGVLAIEWCDSGHNTISTVWTNPIHVGIYPSNVWLEIQSPRVQAPTNAAYLRVLARINNSGSGSGRVYYDDLSLIGVIPEPGSAILAALGLGAFYIRRRFRAS